MFKDIGSQESVVNNKLLRKCGRQLNTETEYRKLPKQTPYVLSESRWYENVSRESRLKATKYTG
jgi:hypothetical protein